MRKLRWDRLIPTGLSGLTMIAAAFFAGAWIAHHLFSHA